MKTQHTPTPWKHTGDRNIHSPDGTCVAIAHGPVGEWGKVGAEHEANAAYIVRAVNAHAEMVEVLKRIDEFLTGRGSLDGSALYDDSSTFEQMVKHAFAAAEGRAA